MCGQKEGWRMKSRRLQVVTVAVAVAVGALVFGTGGGLPAAGQTGTTLVYVRSADSNYLDPGFTTIVEDIDVSVNIYANLLRPGPSGQAEPGLALSWSNTAGRVWIFKLRSGVKFTDGTPVDADAVAFSVNRLAPDSQFHPHGRQSSIGVWLGDLIVHADVVDASTVRIALKNPYALLPEMLATWPVPIVSPTAVRKLGDQFALQPVGSGPYRLGEWVKGDHITLVANPEYWGGAPPIDRAIFKVVPDTSSRLLELKRGSGDFLEGMTPDQRDAVVSDPNLTLLTKPCSCIGYVAINDQKKPFDNVLVRRALNYAIDRETIMRTIEGGLGVVAQSMLPSWMPGYNPNVAKYPYDPAKAKALLAQAGFPSGFSTDLWTFNAERAYLPNVLQVAQRVQSDLAAVGVNAKLTVMDLSVYFGAINSLKGTLTMKGWITPPQADFMITGALLGEQSATYYPKTAHGKQLLAMAQTAAETFDVGARNRIYQQIQRIYMDDAPIVPLMNPAATWVYRKGLTGIEISADGATRFAAVKR
jgi:peptide/nickel transport system substrate-binding protein